MADCRPSASTVGVKPLLSQSRFNHARNLGGCLIAKGVPARPQRNRPPTILFFHVSFAAVSLQNSSRTRYQRGPTKRASRSWQSRLAMARPACAGVFRSSE